MNISSDGNLSLSKEYSNNNLFGPMFYSWCNCPLKPNPIKHYICLKSDKQFTFKFDFRDLSAVLQLSCLLAVFL